MLRPGPPCSCRYWKSTKDRAGIEWYSSTFFECTGNTADSVGKDSCLLVDGEEEVSVDSDISGRR